MSVTSACDGRFLGGKLLEERKHCVLSVSEVQLLQP